jgi:hypothetical protein
MIITRSKSKEIISKMVDEGIFLGELSEAERGSPLIIRRGIEFLPNSYASLDKKFKTKGRKGLAIKSAIKLINEGGLELDDLVEELQTRAVCIQALKINLKDFNHMPERLEEDLRVFKEVFASWSKDYRYLSKSEKQEKIDLDYPTINSMVKDNIEIFRYVPGPLKKRELCSKVLKQDVCHYKNLPEKLKVELRAEADAEVLKKVRDSAEEITFLPKELVTDQVLRVALADSSLL